MAFRGWKGWLLCVSAAAAACGPQRNMGFGDSASGTDATASPDVQGTGCRAQSDCDDNIACTDDYCGVGGVCNHDVNDRLCPSGQRCFASRGCASGASCTRNADCDDRVPCTTDLCVAGGMCMNARDDSQCADNQICSATLGCLARGSCGADTDCDDGRYCNGAERCTGASGSTPGSCAAGTAPSCSDGDPCTADLCSESMRMCTHPAVSPCGGMLSPGTYTLMPGTGGQLPGYSCGAGRFGPVSSVTLTQVGSGVQVSGFPATLTDPAPMGGMFNAQGSWMSGGCTWRFSLSGAFTAANAFQGIWSVSFDFCPFTLGCVSTSNDVRGSR